MENQSEHSPLGASGAERWMSCPGSIALLKALDLSETDEPDYRKEGIAAHAAAAQLLNTGEDAWTVVGTSFHDVEITAQIADAIQVYLDAVRPGIANATLTYIEHRIQLPERADGFGTVDLGLVFNEGLGEITDYKNGHLVVEVEDNPQLMYYAYGMQREFPGIREWALRIVQPNAFHPDGPVREWRISSEDLCEWAEKVLIPAMARTEIDHDLDAGRWCRFCPAKLVCPLLTSLFGAAAKCNPDTIVNLSNDSLGRSYQYIDAVEFYLKALKDETFRRLNKGDEVPETKLVYKKANRVYKIGARERLLAEFGDDAMTKPELKSPAAIEMLGPKAKDLVHELAYTPQTGLTVALISDKRPGVKPRSAAETFSGYVDRVTDPE